MSKGAADFFIPGALGFGTGFGPVLGFLGGLPTFLFTGGSAGLAGNARSAIVVVVVVTVAVVTVETTDCGCGCCKAVVAVCC